MPTLIYGAQNNFCMDLGATEKITLKCERNNPFPYDDSSDDPDDWSNGKWYRHLENIFDRWQNFGKQNGEWTGGVILLFESIDASLYPDLTCNVFLSGSIGLSYNVQKISFNLPFQLGNMQMKDVEVKYVTLTLKSASDSGPKTETVQVLPNTPQQVPFPEEWNNTMVEGKIFIGWRIASTGKFIVDGSTWTFGSDETLDAVWKGAIFAKAFYDDEKYLITCKANRMMVYAVGGGGGGGGSVSFSITWGSSFASYQSIGGGGGAGQTAIQEVEVKPNTYIYVTIGTGGSGGTNESTQIGLKQPTAGGNGNDTIVDYENTVIVRARGGSGGGAAYNPGNPLKGQDGAAGSQYVSGGTAGKDGSCAEPNIYENRGLGGTDGRNDYGTLRGGAGGGAAAFRYAAVYGSTRLPPEGFFASRGGNGISYDGSKVVREPWTGTFGAGGGSGYVYNGTAADGSRGFVLIVFYNTEDEE